MSEESQSISPPNTPPKKKKQKHAQYKGHQQKEKGKFGSKQIIKLFLV
jgi:hypothetical protein